VSVQDWASEQAAMLRRNYPDWTVWYVPLYPTGYVWCAMPAGGKTATINVGSPEQLVAAIAEAERTPDP
jgi:hypothetical protein